MQYLCLMFIKASEKKESITGKVYRYYRLCESYRIGNKVRHRTILSLGKLDEIQSDTQKKILADRIEFYLSGGREIFPTDLPEHVDKLAIDFSSRLQRLGFSKTTQFITEQPVTVESSCDYQEVDVSSLSMEDSRDIGSEWLCRQVLDQLDLAPFLKGLGWSERHIDTAFIHIISKAVYPCSEHKIAQWIRDNSGASELFNRLPDDTNRFDLYRCGRMLYTHKEDIEQHLSVKTNELFDIEDKIILYDLTNSYFEGRKSDSLIARFGRSKEKRNDAKIVALALVVNIEGFVKCSRVYRGNIADCKTMEDTIKDLSSVTSFSGRKPTVVMDAGIATDDNLKMLRDNGYHYVCVSRSRLKDYQPSDSGMVHLTDKRDNPIDICWAQDDQLADRFLYVHSKMKAVKETSMSDHFCHRYEEELDTVARAIHKKGHTKRYGKVMERIGRIKERYPAANKHYDIHVTEKDGIAVEVTWKRKQLSTPTGEGEYFIRTSIDQKSEKLVWNIYNTIRQIEETFRILKTDLLLRPVFHRKDENCMAHLFLAILAYSIVSSVRYKLRKAGIHHSWRNIVRIMNSQKASTVTMNRRDGRKIHMRLCSKPIQGAQEIYKAMDCKPMPFYRKKFVFPES